VLRLHQAEDGWVARVRTPGGALTPRQADALATAAEQVGDGRIGLTSRGNVELRGLAETAGTRLSALLGDAGLLPSPRHERVRNIIATPLSGLDEHGHADVQAWAAALDALLCAQDWTTELSGRFLFVLDDGRGDVAGLGADVTLHAAPGGRALLQVGAGPAHVVAATDAPRAALAAAQAFHAAARAAGTGAWRVRELPAEHRPDVAAALRAAGVAVTGTAPAPEPDAGGRSARPGPGVLPGRDGTAVVSVFAPLGRLSVVQWRLLAGASGVPGMSGLFGGSPEAVGGLRITPWRGILVPGLAPAEAARRLRIVHAAGLLTPCSPGLGVSACTGRPGCAKSRSDVRSDATAMTTTAPAAPAGASGGLLPVHWSGCERRCGHPQGDWVDVVAVEATDATDATDDAVDTDATDATDDAGSPASAYRVTVRRAAGPDLPIDLPARVSGSDLAQAVATARTTPPTAVPAPPRPSAMPARHDDETSEIQ
jgi:precorrin-3B synthase